MSADNWNGLPGGEHVSTGLVIAVVAWFAIWCYWRWWNAREDKRDTDAAAEYEASAHNRAACEHQEQGARCGAPDAPYRVNGVPVCKACLHKIGRAS